MARQQVWISASEVELLRRRLGELAWAADGIPDNVLQKFEHFLTIAYDASRQDEALRFATELFQFYYEQASRRRRLISNSVVSCTLESYLAAALDRFIAEHEGVENRRQAVVVILKDALGDYIE